ncbi:Catechol 2,3-dioxygenase or other lactoylglutathione lyase family enzyme [Nostoc flagelliforme CCNUN1]|uniref:Catechol 2,3-dioxygenase or other lactoylglutathione lyase family enzyme n=1 Tax=Nostoc flagelliforme CCNUN1 TaxID=2038116 RepID=A0A2K8SZW8_9NOSO|nr:glyoxalase [Nostoc flagelliforme]AUB40982.1 Catechol 2,3-dioxygenase or other lactoylglutathione lyase family enzyme [Nostoc flagelliforme CCNUN1]
MVFQYTNAFITIASVNCDNLVSFYTKLLEQKPVILIPNVYAEFNLVSMRLGIFKPKNTNESEFEAMSNDKPLCVYAKSKISLCLEVSNLEDAIAHLTTLGYPPPGDISIASHGREIYAYDPDGNRIILHQAPVNDN